MTAFNGSSGTTPDPALEAIRAGGLVPLALILLLAIALGDVAQELGTGVYVANVTAGVLPPVIFLPTVFLVSGFVAFSVSASGPGSAPPQASHGSRPSSRSPGTRSAHR